MPLVKGVMPGQSKTVLAFVLFLTAAGITIILLLMLCLIQMLRNALRSGPLNRPKPPPALAVKNERGFNLKMDVKNLNFNDQILIINSSLLGDTAKDNNSFTQSLLRLVTQLKNKIVLMGDIPL